MARYTGTLTDCGLASLTPFKPILKFVLIPEASFALVGNQLLTTRPVQVTPGTTGAFSVELVPNDEIRGNTKYLVRAEWLDPAGVAPTSLDVFEFFARAGGGDITEMAAAGPGMPAQVFWQSEQPDPWPPGWIWVNSVTGDVKRRN